MSQRKRPQLFYCQANGGMENRLFAPGAVAGDTRAIRSALEGCSTWGQAREALSEEQYVRLIAKFRAPAAGKQKPDEPLGNVSGWPCLFVYQVSDGWLPEEVSQRMRLWV